MASIPQMESDAINTLVPANSPPEGRPACAPRPKLGDNVVGVGEYAICGDVDHLVCIGLGSCVGIAIWDPANRIGGLAHAMLPKFENGRDKTNAAKYADTAVFIMVDELVERGAKKCLMKAKMAGGAQMFQFATNDMLNIGQKNAEVAREALKKENIQLLGEDCGGNKGRTVSFYPANGTYRIQRSQEYYEI